ncbi:MAG TPA: carboxymuconolactone decarboxylase family protein [Tepidisphaeraceae bacterium]|jgi:alkyl hydroperoxide reductase subunit D|nr:carboxymuconolactone decarboxylase family protein [Tepidisphaeraceae bacterium]
MEALEALRQKLPEFAKDIKLNLQTVLGESSLTAEQKWGVAVASAATVGNSDLLAAAKADAAAAGVAPGVIEDALAAAVLMGMNNVYYRFRHMVGKPGYSTKPARLRMNRMAQPAAGSKANSELFALAVSAINACELCIQSHEKVVTEAGLSEDQVNDAARIAATFAAAAVALRVG